MSRVGANYVDLALAADHFAVLTYSLDAGANFHRKAFQGEIFGISKPNSIGFQLAYRQGLKIACFYQKFKKITARLFIAQNRQPLQLFNAL